MKKYARTEKNRLFVKRIKQSICLLLFMLCSSFILSSCSDEVNEPQNNGWQDYTADIMEQKLKEACGNESVDVNSLVTSLKVNKNVEDAFATADKMQVAVKLKGEDTYSVYPIHLVEDLFDDDVDPQSDSQSYATSNVDNHQSSSNTPRPVLKGSGAAGKVAIFNYFSDVEIGTTDKLGTRYTQNRMVEFMANELNRNDYSVEYYVHNNMTLENIKKVLDNKSQYKAVIIMSHGFSDGSNSYFAIGEEYDKNKANNPKWKPLLNPELTNYSVPLEYKLWNEDWPFSGKYEFVIPVQKMTLGSGVLLYLGSCDALANQSDVKHLTNNFVNCIGWDGVNCSAQAHAAVFFHKLMRGKHLYDALDINDSMNPYYDFVVDQIDTWTKDPVHNGTELVWTNMHTNAGLKGFWAKKNPQYLKVGNNYPRLEVRDKDNNYLMQGHYFNKDKDFKLKFDFRGDLDSFESKYIWIKATPLRSDKDPIIYKINKTKLSKGVKVELNSNGVWDFSAAIDENFNTELLIYKPVVVVYAKPFKDNSILPGGDIQPEAIDLGLPSGTKWASFNVGAEAPEDYGDYFAWGETVPKDVYDWSTYKWCNGDYNKLTKYCNNSSYGNNGFTDGKTELDPEDDAATANWGPEWRMPSQEQMQELIDNVTWQWTTVNGVNGQMITSNVNGASLFLPASGICYDNVLDDVNTVSSYLSRNLYTTFPNHHYFLYISPWHGIITETGYCRRSTGQSVRAVYVSQD